MPASSLRVDQTIHLPADGLDDSVVISRISNSSTSRLRGRVALTFGSIALLSVVIAIGAALAGRRTVAAGPFEAVINEGQISWSETVSTGRDGIVAVRAGSPIEIEFSSRDFVYVVEQPDLNLATVVLPKGTSRLQFRARAGLLPIQILSGCGETFIDHPPLMLRAIP